MWSIGKGLRLSTLFLGTVLLVGGNAAAVEKSSGEAKTLEAIEVRGSTVSWVDWYWWYFFQDGGGAAVSRDWLGDAFGGGGGGYVATDTAKSRSVVVQKTDCKGGQQPQKTDKPVIIATGNKVLDEMDFIVPSYDEYPLVVARNYDKSLVRTGIFGPRWASSLERTLSFQYGSLQCHGRLDRIESCATGGAALDAIYANRSSGFSWKFTAASDGRWVSGDEATLTASGSGWLLILKDGSSELYDAYGRPLKVSDPRGVGLTWTDQPFVDIRTP